MKGIFYGKAGQVYLVRCPRCGMENYAPNVSKGICTWCGFKAPNKNPSKKKVK